MNVAAVYAGQANLLSLTDHHRPALLQLCAVDFTAWHFLMPLMRRQREAGFEVELACSPGPFTGMIEAEGFQHHPVRILRNYNVASHWSAYRRLVRLMRERCHVVMHAHTPVAALIGRPAARRAGVPVVLYTAHGFYFHDRMPPWMRRMHIWLERRAHHRADFLFTENREDLRTAIKEGIAPECAAMAIGNGVDVDYFAPEAVDENVIRRKRAELGFTDAEGPIVMVIGRLVREKGHLEFLEAFAALKDSFPAARAVVIGETLESDRDGIGHTIKQRAAALGLGDRVRFAGLRRDVRDLLSLADVFCLPSWREGMPRSVIEAMALGKPVITTDIRGCREEVVDGRTGRLVPVQDAAALERALAELLSDEAQRRRMGDEGRQRARQLFDEANVIERQMKVMREIFEQKGLRWPER